MLQFLLGRPASGKTYTVLQKIKKLTEEGKNSVLIVPEQFTFESEKAILKVLGDKSALYISVTSFTRLYDEIGRKIGGIAATFLRDSDKIVFMNKALNSVADELLLWGKYKSSVSFSKTMLDTIGELKINSVTPEKLKNASKSVNSISLKNKLQDLSKIYEAYDLLLGERFIDPADTLTKIYESLKEYDYFKGKTVFLDSFKGFTGQQYKIIERILSQADDVLVSLTDDPEIKGEYCAYANIRNAISDIKAIAKSRAVKISEPIILNKSYYNSPTITAVERTLVGENIEDDGKDLVICKAQTLYDEAEFAASTIRRLVRTQGYRYRDFVIIARDSEKYKSAIETACRRNKVNCFYDNKIPLSAFPICSLVRSAIDALNLSTEAILNFHKTGLGTLKTDEIATLENYTLVWDIKGNMWHNVWDMDPRGLTADQDINDESTLLLEEINNLRLRAFKPILNFKENFVGNASSRARAIVKLFDDCNVGTKLNKMCRDYKGINNNFYADAIKSSYDEFMKILDSMVLCFGDATITAKVFYDAINLAVSLDSVGIIPQTADEVIFGSADRIRPSRPKIAFILGANQGEFPQTVGNQGIFGLSERKALINNGINISDNSVEASINENYLVYCNLCCSSDKLYISYSENSLLGEKKEPSAFISQLCDNIKCDVISYPLNVNIPETEIAAFTEYCRLLKSSPTSAAALKEALVNTEFAPKINSLGEGKVKKEDGLSSATAKELYGKNINMSATRLDTFNRCHFSYFCRYGLKAEKLKSADFNVLQRGTIVHYCLEKIISEYKKGIADLDYSFLDVLCDRYIEEYLNMVGGFKSVKNAKTEFLISRISRSLKEVVRSISDEMKQCDFEPISCELRIGGKGEIPTVHFPFNKGDLLLTGSIDRVDMYNGYVRIIDYKTGSKSFKMPDILFGLNLQMLLYLYCLVRAKGIPNSTAAGILYKPSKRDINDSGMAMNGLLPADINIVKAMDKESNGEFVPRLKVKTDGTIGKVGDSFINLEDFELIFDHIERVMKNTGNLISGGDISVTPINGRETDACKYCEYKFICGIEDAEIKRVEKISNSDVIAAIKEDENAH